MNDSIREQLSAMADGEVEAEGARFLLKRLERDSEFRGVWERYHLMRDCLRHQGTMAPPDFCAGVSARIDAEEAAERRKPAARSSWRGLGGAAIAAGVAAVALFGVRMTPGAEDNALGAANLAQTAPMTTSDLVPAWQLTPVADREQFLLVQQPIPSEIDGYFTRHGEAAGGVGPLGPLPSVLAVAQAPSGRVQGDRVQGEKACASAHC
jgi:sigma-E factor negative regulatory protein RseA